MNVSLTPELEQFIESKVASGMYQTASEVVREGLRLLKDDDIRKAEYEELKKAIAKGIADADAGRERRISPTEILAEVRRKPAKAGSR